MKKFIYIFIIIISLISIIFVNNNYFLYKSEIMDVTSIKDINFDYDYNDLGIKEKIYYQKICGNILNGKNKGKKVCLKHQYAKSQVIDDKYHIHDKLFINDNSIEGLKRDSFFLYLIIISFVSMIFVAGRRGFFSFVSLIINILLFYFFLFCYSYGFNPIILCLLVSFLFTIISLFISVGFNKKAFASIISVIVCLLLLFTLIEGLALITKFKGINFNILSYLTVPAEEIFIVSLIFGGLGAIMDVAITISSSVFELIQLNKKITNNAIIKSCKEIGTDILPTMINVLFFTYFASELPLFVLAIRNGFSIYNYISTYYSLEVMRFLCGSIGLCLSIVISIFVSIKLYRRGDFLE